MGPKRATGGVLGAAALLVSAAPATAQGVDVSMLGHTLGDPDAPVAIVEFGDFACSACAEFWRVTWPRVRAELVETGRVVWRHVPFDFGFRRSEEAANAGECAAAQGAFWEMHDRLFAGREEWSDGGKHEEIFAHYATELGLDVEAFEHCYEDEELEDRWKEATKAARMVGVRGTPTFFVAGRPAVGALPWPMLLELVERAEAERAAGVGRRR